MTDLLVVAELPSEDGQPENTVVNNFTFRGVDADPNNDADTALSGVINFYTTTTTGQAGAVGAYLAGSVERAASGCRLKAYNITGHLDGSAHGSPIRESAFTMPAPGSTSNFPPQVAAVITLRAHSALTVPVEAAGGAGEPATIRPRSRRTGRLYLGPINYAAGAGHLSSEYSRLHATFRDDLAKACEALQDYVQADGMAWTVWSRTAANVHGIERVEVDDSWDVIRSRKVAQISRTVRTFSPIPSLVLGA